MENRQLEVRTEALEGKLVNEILKINQEPFMGINIRQKGAEGERQVMKIVNYIVRKWGNL